MKMNTMILLLATLSSGLMAGLFYSWTISVLPGLAKVNDVTYLQSFQSMNRAILNPAFFIFFMGQVLLLLLLCFMFFQKPVSTQYWSIVAASLLYFIGIMGVTFIGNVPLNNMLEALQIDAMSPEQMKSFRQGFESKWNNLNMIRTITAGLSLLFLIIACLQNSGK